MFPVNVVKMPFTQAAKRYLTLLLQDLGDMRQKTTNQNQEWTYWNEPSMMKEINASIIPILREQKASKGLSVSAGNISTEKTIDFLTRLEKGERITRTVNQFQAYRIKLENAWGKYDKEHPGAGGKKARKTRRRSKARSTRRRT